VSVLVLVSCLVSVSLLIDLRFVDGAIL
jgi:hypothetical protein